MDCQGDYALLLPLCHSFCSCADSPPNMRTHTQGMLVAKAAGQPHDRGHKDGTQTSCCCITQHTSYKHTHPRHNRLLLYHSTQTPQHCR